MDSVRLFLSIEALAFAAAALVHGGILVSGYEHRQACIAESVIACVLAAGLIVATAAPRLTRAAALATQGFALLGTLVGVTMIAIGVGPQSVFDVALHGGFLTLLIAGLTVTARRPSAARADALRA